MTGYIYNNCVELKGDISINLLHTTGDICDTNKYSNYYSLFIDSTNMIIGDLHKKQYIFTLYLSSQISINKTIIPIFNKSYDIYIKLFNTDNLEISFVINTDNKIIIADNLYKLTYSFSCDHYYSNLLCHIKGYMNDYFLLDTCNDYQTNYIINYSII